MRKQYYFQPSKNGFYAWDVNKLIDKTRTLPVLPVGLGAIEEIDENFWYQGQGDIPTCRSMVDHFRLMNDTDLSHSIILSNEGRVMDGMHRVAKALFQGHNEIKAVRFTEEIPPDYVDVYPDDLPYQTD